MKFVKPFLFALLAGTSSARAIKRDNGFSQGEPINTQTGKGAPHSGESEQPLTELFSLII